MKITDVEIQSYAWPRPKPIRTGKHTYTDTGLSLVYLHTDEGITGIGWGGTIVSTAFSAIQAAMLDQFKPYLINEDPFAYRRIWENMWQPKIVGRRGISTHVISAVDTALWDLMGKAVGKPVYKLLGGFRDRVPAYIRWRILSGRQRP